MGECKKAILLIRKVAFFFNPMWHAGSSPVMPCTLGSIEVLTWTSRKVSFPHFEGRCGMFTGARGSVPWYPGPHSSVRYGIWFKKFPLVVSVICAVLSVSPSWVLMQDAAGCCDCSVFCPSCLWFPGILLQKNSESGLKMNLWEYFLPFRCV